MSFVPRVQLCHEIPSWVRSGAVFFITMNLQRRGSTDLVKPETATVLLDAVMHYHVTHRWFVRLFLVMPDHVHGLVSFPPDERMDCVVRDWKKYTSRAAKVTWARDFFDHRIRDDANLEEKAHYIRMNPVRAGLVDEFGRWPWWVNPT